MKSVTGWQLKQRNQTRGCSPLSCQEMQEQMAAEAGYKATNAPGHQSNTQMFLSFSKSKLLYLEGNLREQTDIWAHLDPTPKSWPKQFPFKSPAILIWQPVSITGRRNCFSCHQQLLGNYLNCVVIMPERSDESLLSNAGAPHERGSVGSGERMSERSSPALFWGPSRLKKGGGVFSSVKRRTLIWKMLQFPRNKEFKNAHTHIMDGRKKNVPFQKGFSKRTLTFVYKFTFWWMTR